MIESEIHTMNVQSQAQPKLRVTEKYFCCEIITNPMSCVLLNCYNYIKL